MANNQANGLIHSLMAALERDSRVDVHQYPLRVSNGGAQLVLEGDVENIAAKKVIARTARQVAGDQPVIDRLRVSSIESREDGALRTEVMRALLEEPVFTEYTIRVGRNQQLETVREGRGDGEIDIHAEGGAVCLEGNVGSLTHRRLAEVLTWWTAGCQRVNNRLHVTPAEQETDDELADAIHMVLEKDPLVHSSQLSVAVREQVVTLRGYVASDEERRLALMDAWYVPGVHDVVDQVQTPRRP